MNNVLAESVQLSSGTSKLYCNEKKYTECKYVFQCKISTVTEKVCIIHADTQRKKGKF